MLEYLALDRRLGLAQPLAQVWQPSELLRQFLILGLLTRDADAGQRVVCGTAYAANTVLSTDIVDGEVKSPQKPSDIWPVTSPSKFAGARTTLAIAGGASRIDLTYMRGPRR